MRADLLRRHLYFTSFCLATVLFLLPSSLTRLVSFSLSHEYASHVILILPVACFLVYSNRAHVFSAAKTDILPGTICVIVGLIALALVHFRLLGNDNDLSAEVFCLIFLWASAFLLCYGSRAMRAAGFAWLFLLLMVPIPDFVLKKTVYFLQSGSTWLTYWLLRIADVPVFKDGFLLRFPSLDVEVAEQCSGIRSSLALLITTLLVGHFSLKSLSRKLLFVLSIIPIVLFKNAIRIITISMLTIHVDRSFMHSPLHTSGGGLFYLLGLFSLIPILVLLRRSENRAQRSSSRSRHSAREAAVPNIAQVSERV